MDPQLADIRQSMYPLHSYIPSEQVHPHNCFSLENLKMGPTKIDSFQYCGEVFPFCPLKQCKIH